MLVGHLTPALLLTILVQRLRWRHEKKLQFRSLIGDSRQGAHVLFYPPDFGKEFSWPLRLEESTPKGPATRNLRKFHRLVHLDDAT